jgi:hypothetical protein
MLERITDFMSHPELVFGYDSPPNSCALLTVSTFLAPITRNKLKSDLFESSCTIYLAGTSSLQGSRNRTCHTLLSLRVAGIESPYDSYNPVLGEFFRCRYDYNNGTSGYYIAEQGALGHAPWNH